jgi:hypothetical protein
LLRFPAIWSLGVAWRPQDWKVEADLVFTEWSLFTDLPDRVRADAPRTTKGIVEEYDDALSPSASGRSTGSKLSLTVSATTIEQEAAAYGVGEARSFLTQPATERRSGWALDSGPTSEWKLDLYDLALFVQERSTEGRESRRLQRHVQDLINSVGFNVGYHW